jgi:hypothetical protein
VVWFHFLLTFYCEDKFNYQDFSTAHGTCLFSSGLVSGMTTCKLQLVRIHIYIQHVHRNWPLRVRERERENEGVKVGYEGVEFRLSIIAYIVPDVHVY